MDNNENSKTENTPMVPLPYQNMTPESLENAVKVAEKFIEALAKVKKIAIKLTNAGDWIDQNGTPYLQDTGCAAISKAFGIRVSNISQQVDNVKDDRGEYLIVTTEGYGEWNNNMEHSIGTCSTRDKFFAMRDMALLPLSEVDLPNVKKKSHTNFHNRLIKKLLALSYTWKEIEEYSDGEITQNKVTGVTYDQGKQGGKATESKEIIEKRSKLRRMILDLNGDDKESARAYLCDMTKSDKYKGKNTVDEIKTEKQLDYIYNKVKKQHDALLEAQTQQYDDLQKEQG